LKITSESIAPVNAIQAWSAARRFASKGARDLQRFDPKMFPLETGKSYFT
jgi:hypothetical protein